MAVSLLLLVGAGLVTRSLEAARHADPGFDAAHVTVGRAGRQPERLRRDAGRVFYRQLLDAGARRCWHRVSHPRRHHPLALLDTRSQRVAVEGYAPGATKISPFLSNTVGPDYFRTLRIRLPAGREFADRDDETAAPVAIVNHTFARALLGRSGRAPSASASGWPTATGARVVGVAADVKYLRINEAPRPYVYVPFLQVYRPA